VVKEALLFAFVPGSVQWSYLFTKVCSQWNI